MLGSPLEQFEILLIFPFRVFGLDLSLTNASLYMLLSLGLLVLLFAGALAPVQRLIPSRWQFIVEQAYLFVLGILKQQAGPSSVVYLPMLFAVFLLIVTLNLLGLTPFGFTVTSHILFTFSFALSFNLGIFFLGLQLHGLTFFKLFVPSGVPAALLPLIVMIEVLSYVIRTFSLALRLFANMMAGHTLLQILSSFVVVFVSTGGLASILGVLPLLLVLGCCYKFPI